MKNLLLSFCVAGLLVACALKSNLSFENKEFKVISLQSEGKELLYKGDEPSRLSFKGGQFSGFVGCNNFFGSYSLKDDRLLISENVGATKMLCPPEIMAFEDEFLYKFKGEFTLSEKNGLLILHSKGLELRLSK